jgi:hypothetical protein
MCVSVRKKCYGLPRQHHNGVSTVLNGFVVKVESDDKAKMPFVSPGIRFAPMHKPTDASFRVLQCMLVLMVDNTLHKSKDPLLLTIVSTLDLYARVAPRRIVGQRTH